MRFLQLEYMPRVLEELEELLGKGWTVRHDRAVYEDFWRQCTKYGIPTYKRDVRIYQSL